MPGSAPTVDYTFKKLPNGPTIAPDSENFNQAVAHLDDGDYELTLTLSNPGKPTCKETQTLQLHKPDAHFSIANNPACTEDPVILQPDNPTPGATYKWKYQEATNTVESISTTLGKTNVMGTPIKLTVTDPYGCSSSFTQNIVVNKAHFTIELKASPSDEICEGSSTELSYDLN